MDSETVTYIVQLLHTNGLYAAEDALLRELEERCPEPAEMQPFLPETPEHTAVTFHASAGLQLDHDGVQEQPARQAVQDRHTAQQDDFGAQGFNSSSYTPADQPAEPSPSDYAEHQRVTEANWDDYIDEEDPGYIREDIRGQDAFVARELDVSDADGSRRAMDLYHQAMDPPAQAPQCQRGPEQAYCCRSTWEQEWAQGEGADGDRSSSDGRGSSYFSGERLDQNLSSTASPMHSQQSLTGHVDRASLAERTVVLAEPVYPADSPACSTHSVSRAGSTSGDLGSLGVPPPGSAEMHKGPQRSGAEQHAQVSDAATTRAAAILVAASSGANFHQSASSRDHEYQTALSSSAPEHSSRSFLDPLGIVEKVSDVFSRRVQPRSDSETSKHSTANIAGAVPAMAEKQAPLDKQKADVRAQLESLTLAKEQTAGEVEEQQREGTIPNFNLRVKAPEAHRPIRTTSGASGAGAKASGPLDPASPSGISEEDENFSFPLTPPSEPAAPAAVFSSWHSFRKRSSKGYDTDDDLSMGRVSDFSVEPSQESNSGYPHGGAETQHTLQNAAGKLDSARTADSSGEGSKHSPEPQPCSAAESVLAPEDAREPPPQPSLQSEASLARDVTLGKPGSPFAGELGSREHDNGAIPEAADSRYLASGSNVVGPQRMGSTEGTEMLTMSCNGQQADVAALLCSSPPREAWPSILLQPQTQSAPAQPPLQASMPLLDSPVPAAPTPFAHPLGPIPDTKPLLAHAPFGSSVLPRAVEDPTAQGVASTEPDLLAAQHGAGQHDAPAYTRVLSKDMMATPSRLSRASSARCGDSSQALPPTPMSTAAECSSPPSMAAVSHARQDGRAAGMRGVAHSSLSSLDGVTTSQRDRDAAAKARASLDFSLLSERAAKGTRPQEYQRAQSADIPGQSKTHSQMLAPVQPLNVSLSLSQHELEKLQKGALQRRKPPPLTPAADDAPPPSAAGTSAEAEQAGPAGHAQSQQGGHPLAGGSPAASVAVQRMGGPTAGEQAADSGLAYEYDPDYIERKYEILELKVIHRRRRTGFEETKDFPIRVDDLIAGRYQVMDFLGSAAFSRAVQALDVKTRRLVCLKIIKNNKDYFDQSLDEVKLLSYINNADPVDEHGLLRLYDYFYYKEHLFLVCELLRANLYEFQKYNRDSGNPPYFVLQRVQSIARQVLTSLAFLHSLGLIHSDLKPENILIKSYSRCEVKVIDFGSSCFTTDQLSSYVQSRSYRAPEVILGLPYGQKVDVWSLGCILAELLSGYVLFQNDSLATLLARLEGILGPVPQRLLNQGRYTHRFYTRSGALFERNSRTHRYEYLHPKQTSIGRRVPEADGGCRDFLLYLLTVDPQERPTAEAALQHPWLQHRYPAPPIQ